MGKFDRTSSLSPPRVVHSSWHATTMGLSTKNYANIAAFIFNMVVAAAIGFGLVGESNEFVSAK